MSELTDGIKKTLTDLAADAKAAKDVDYERKCLAAIARCDWPTVEREGEKMRVRYTDATAAFELAKFLLV